MGYFQECVFPETTMACKTLLIPRETTENSTLMPQQDGMALNDENDFGRICMSSPYLIIFPIIYVYNCTL